MTRACSECTDEPCELCALVTDLDELRAELVASSVELAPQLLEQMHGFAKLHRRALADNERDAAMLYGLGLQRLYYSALYAS